MTNIRDIARLSGYSVSTISRYINHSGYVSLKAGEEIQAVINKVNYAPNTLARDLSRGKTFNVGVVIPHTKHPYFTNILEGIMDAAFASGYHVVLLPSKYDADLEIEYLEQLRRKSYDALIFTSRGIPLAKLVEYQKYGPIVCCSNPGKIKLAAAYSLKKDTFISAFEWIKSQGYRNVGILLSRNSRQSVTSDITLKCYTKVFGKKIQILDAGVTTYDDGYRAASAFYQQKLPLDFIFANGDDVAMGVRQFFLDHNLPVPEMMGQENQLSGRIVGLSTIDHQYKKVGQMALKLAVSGKIKQVAIKSSLLIKNH